MKKNILSIIIPTYNSSSSLKLLLSKILSIKLNCEIIVVNDCSSDNTKDILSKFDDIKVINNVKNYGVSYSRNIGIKESHGDYIAFIDSDDMIDDDYFTTLNKYLNYNYDLIVFGTKLVYDNRNEEIEIPYNKMIRKEQILNEDKFLSTSIMHWITNKCFKRSLFDKVLFNNKLDLGEDLDIMLKLFDLIDSVYFVNKYLYYYNRTNINSITQSNIQSLPSRTNKNNKKIKRFFTNHNLNKVYYFDYEKGMYDYVKKQIDKKVKDDKLKNILLFDNYILNGKKIEKTKFSIIIPSHNVEKYISKTIHSILNQTYSNYEIIIVDDESTDMTCDIISNIADNRISLYRIKKSGVSCARNVGLRKASGDYIVFIDSDDYIEDWLLEYLNNELLINNNITFIGTFNTVREGKDCRKCECKSLDSKYIDICSKKEVLDYLYKKRIIFTVWRFVVSRKTIEKNNIYFVEGIVHEDEEWVPRMLAASNKFKLIHSSHYNYRIRDGSIMTKESIDFYKEKCLIKVSGLLLERAEHEKDIINKQLFMRNSYKNLFQAYLKIRSKSNPLEPFREENKNYNKNIIIYGSSRSGKTTLAYILKYRISYSVISLDNIVSGFEKGIPALGISHSNRDGTSVSKLNSFINSYIHSLNGINQKSKGYYYIIEGSYFSEENIMEYFRKYVVIIMISGYNRAKELYNELKKHDVESDWTINLNDEDLMNYCENVIKDEQRIMNFCEKNNVPYYKTGYNRALVFDKIQNDILDKIKGD